MDTIVEVEVVVDVVVVVVVVAFEVVVSSAGFSSWMVLYVTSIV